MKTIVHEDKAFIEDVIRRCQVCYAGVVTTGGKPYVIPMNFGYRDGKLYLHSARVGRVVESLEKNPAVCITFSVDHDLVFQHPQVACSYRMKSKSVIAFGNVQFIEEMDKKREALDIIMRQYSDKNFVYGDPAVKNVLIWVVEVEEFTCKEFAAPHEKFRK